ncbi:hypothetical protein FF36_04184 [Frankia torreyi]|uniref:Uncharacterized protein n=1 Tax=Frankia torreyi TaxID=1856 RepID=A0A0D8BBC8_9ACTN|nr:MULTISPECIES: hypothetical protein [Frankia]KJE21496.1 hypothetical protein FF36_04184 [Frankia torreyi]KQM03510.1 Frankia-40 domain [Frankia sp. CpI1-P]
MPIFSSDAHGAWRTPGDDHPMLLARVDHNGDHELTIRPGADIGDLVALLATLPPDAFFTEHYGDVDATLIFRPVPERPATTPTGGSPTAGPAAASVTRP